MPPQRAPTSSTPSTSMEGGGVGANLSPCHLQYGGTFYPELEYDEKDETRIHRDLIEYNYRKKDYNTGTQLNVANYSTLYPVVYFDLRAAKESMTGDEKKLILHYCLDKAATQDYSMFAAVLNEEESVIRQIENELVIV